MRAAAGAVLLIDEIDRSDSEFEAFLLEFLGDFQITIPEVGTIRAARPPVVVLTSNRTRELHDALKRRCLYHWIPFPDAERERQILRAHAPGLDEAAAAALVESITRVRSLKLLKKPGIAETIDWAQGAATLVRRGQRVAGRAARLARAAAEGAGGRRDRSGARPAMSVAAATEHLHGFLRSLEDAGVGPAPPKKADFLRAVVSSPPDSVTELYWRARVTLVSRPEDFEAFEAVFDAWFRGGRLLIEESLPALDQEGETAAPPSAGDGDLEDVELGEGTGTAASAADLANTRTFGATSDAGREQLADLGAALRGALPEIGARRTRRARRGRVLDVRHVLRGGEPDGRRGGAADLAAAPAAAAPRAAADRRLRLAARAQRRPAAVRARRAAHRRARRGVHVRHPPHARHEGAVGARRRPSRSPGSRSACSTPTAARGSASRCRSSSPTAATSPARAAR